MKISRETLREFREDFMAAIAPLEDKYDVTVKLGYISFNADEFSSKMRNDFDANVWKYEHLGGREGMYKRVFTGADGHRYAITGFNTRAKKRAILMIRVIDGVRFATSEGFVREVTDEIYAENLAEVVVEGKEI